MSTNTDLLDTAACLWEAALDAQRRAIGDFASDVHDAFEQHGTAEVRTAVVSGADAVAAFFDANMDAINDAGMWCFDWDYCPVALDTCFNWSALSWTELALEKLPCNAQT